MNPIGMLSHPVDSKEHVDYKLIRVDLLPTNDISPHSLHMVLINQTLHKPTIATSHEPHELNSKI